MVALDAVAPRSAVGRSTEHREVIFLGVATLAAVALYDLEHVFQAHDGHGFDVASLAQPSRQQRAGEVLLIRRHLAQRQAFALLRDEVPVHPLVSIEWEGRFAALIGIQRGEKAVGALGLERRGMNVVRMDLVGLAVVRGKHTGSDERGRRTEKRSAFHAHEFGPRCLFANESTEMRLSQWRGPCTLRPFRNDRQHVPRGDGNGMLSPNTLPNSRTDASQAFPPACRPWPG